MPPTGTPTSAAARSAPLKSPELLAPPPVEPLAVDAERAASLCGISVRHWWALHSSGRCPSPIRLGRAVRWRTDELRAWLAAGCPNRDAWQAMRND